MAARFSILLVTIALAVMLGGCQPKSEGDSSYADISREENLQLKESPLLAKEVAAGELPPLEDRLPEDPRIVEPVETPGLYGGTWRRFHLYPDFPTFRLINNYWGLTRWNPETTDIIPGIATSWEFNDAGNEITFHLRKGVRWSDGEPFDSSDIAFWWDVATDDRTSEMPQEWAYSGGELMELETPDLYTVVFKYKEPFYTLPVMMATGFWVPETVIRPAHYLKQFHPDYTDEYEDFTEFDRKFGDITDVNRPTLGPWMLTYISGTSDRVIFERNPYYWTVDKLGRQLPYIDRVVSTRVQSSETGVLMIMSGNIDAQFRYVSRQDYGLLKQFADEGNYQIRRWEEGTGALFAIVVNMENKDPERAKLLTNKCLREGIAYAIDRELINQVIWGGLSEPRGATITDESWHFQSPRGQEVLERWKKAWSEFNVDKANAKLDEAGLTMRDKNGYRMYDGKPLTLIVDVQDWPLAMDEAILVQGMLRNVGLNVLLQRDIGGRRDRRVREAEFDLYMQHMSEMDLFTFPGYVFPVVAYYWHPQTGRWYITGGDKGKAPTGWTKELVDIFDEIKRTKDQEKRHDLVLDAIEIQLREGPVIIGTTGRQFAPVVTKRNLRNIPKSGVIGPWAIVQPANRNPEQFFFDPDYKGDGESDGFRAEATR
ncbi:ABC transporter substrate-binding protein [bacterium]|nr:ABC transporter substrate-binding protein [bacterium]